MPSLLPQSILLVLLFTLNFPRKKNPRLLVIVPIFYNYDPLIPEEYFHWIHNFGLMVLIFRT